MNQQAIIGTILSLFLLPAVALADVALQGEGRAVYFHKAGDEIVISICKEKKAWLEGRTEKGIMISDSEKRNFCADPIIRKAPEQQFANHLKLIMLSDRVVFDGEVKDQVELY